ncbi:MAG: hypothetical protein Q9186_000188 [Xanthomendoza sp. 1 TL-2023]
MPRYTTNNPPSGSAQSQWDSFSSTHDAASYLNTRPTSSFSQDAFASNNRPTSQHRRWNLHSPHNSGAINTPLPNLSSREYHNLNTPPLLPELRNPQPDISRQLPGIESLTQDFPPADFPASDLSWGSFGDDSLFDGDFWPDLQHNSFDPLINNNNNNNNNNPVNDDHFVDLTTDPSSPLDMPPVTRKRRSSTADPHIALSTPPSRNNKRPRLNSSDVKNEDVKVEHLDLVDMDDDGGLSKVLAQQQAAAIKEQQAPHGDVPTKLSNLQCIICMEPMTDMTVTHCGEPGKGTSKCPVCRKKVARPKEKSRDKREVIPLEIKFVTKRSRLDKGKAKE